MSESDWWMERADWPQRPELEEAVALLLLEDHLVLLDAKGVAGLYVNCGDTFAYAYADAEPLPSGDERSIWALYDLIRRHGERGAILWCCQRRGGRPLPEVEKLLREAGCWASELDALPAWPGVEAGNE